MLDHISPAFARQKLQLLTPAVSDQLCGSTQVKSCWWLWKHTPSWVESCWWLYGALVACSTTHQLTVSTVLASQGFLVRLSAEKKTCYQCELLLLLLLLLLLSPTCGHNVLQRAVPCTIEQERNSTVMAASSDHSFGTCIEVLSAVDPHATV
jgi:hypothetical protein